ncbi:hypothetical protein FS749_005937 [Ceratobasidium sp. UAMH 11750]|nr:hypothetical protein FS749_005937 [Ceratobasidium sp. UAMH 11750]
MQDNQYKAYVSAHDPSKIIATIDWVKDGPAVTKNGWLTGLHGKILGQSVFGPGEGAQSPVQAVASSSEAGGTYHVWKWGVNDPQSGN